MSEILLETRDLKTYFRTPAGLVRAVDGVTLAVARGETVGIVGESGSGKSVLSRSIMNVLPRRTAVRAGGTVTFRGLDVANLPHKHLRKLWGREMAMIFQDPMTALNPVMRIGDQLMEPLRIRLGFGWGEARERAIELLGQVGIPSAKDRMNEYPHQLSGGMRQRVVIAIALSCGPSLIIADEPTTALDVTVQRQILDLLAREQATRRMGLILVTHDLGVVATRADRIAVMYAGRIVEAAPTAALFQSMRHPYTQALMQSIPRLENPSHTRLNVIPGRPPSLVDPLRGCRFAPRCRYAQPRCFEEDPSTTEMELALPEGKTGVHGFACFYPVGTEAGEAALARNSAVGRASVRAHQQIPAKGADTCA